MLSPREHGGPDAFGAAPHDFSTCTHPAGPCPTGVRALLDADARRYPDPASTALRRKLAERHAVAPERVLVAASASEFIQRITAAALALAPGPVVVPRHGYGDYTAAARAWDRTVVAADASPGRKPALRWCADPGSPCGQDDPVPPDLEAVPTVLDRAYTPLRLTGRSPWAPAACEAVFQLWTPNKAMGLPGVRAAYAIAPRLAPPALIARLHALAPSWPLGAHGEALLHAWCEPQTAAWLAAQRETVARWRATLVDGLRARGCDPLPGSATFVCVRVPAHWRGRVKDLRAQGVAVRDATSFGLPGHWRLNALPPPSQTALWRALDAIG